MRGYIGSNVLFTLGQTYCLHWVEEEPYVGLQKDPTVGRLTDPQ